MKDKILEWFANGETGSSSETMACAIAGISRSRKSHPYDPADFNRCVKFLAAVPEARQHMDKVAAISDVWAILVEHWDELEGLLDEELPQGTAPKLYDRMKELGC